MEYPEYHLLPDSPKKSRSVEISVVFIEERDSPGRSWIPPREIDLQHLLGIISPKPFLMTFDEHPYWVTGINIDLSKRKVSMTATLDSCLR